MVKAFFLFDDNSLEANATAKNCSALLNKMDCSSSFSSRPLSKQDIIAADYLIIVLSEKSDPYNALINDGYRYFLDEITWKRKPDGEVIILAPPSLEVKKLPYKLREKRVFPIGDFSELIKYLTGEEKEVKSTEAVLAPHQIKVSARVESIVQPVYNPKKITTDDLKIKAKLASSDKQKSDADKQKPTEPKKRNTGACMDDHIFPELSQSASDGIYTKNSYAQTSKVDKSVYTDNKKSVNATYKKDYKQSNRAVNNKSGCMIFTIIFIFAVIAAVIIIAIVSILNSAAQSGINFNNGFSVQISEIVSACKSSNVLNGIASITLL